MASFIDRSRQNRNGMTNLIGVANINALYREMDAPNYWERCLAAKRSAKCFQFVIKNFAEHKLSTVCTQTYMLCVIDGLFAVM